MAEMLSHMAVHSQNGTKDPLITSLDESLARYLRLLDQYETARAALQKSLSSVQTERLVLRYLK